ncbi:MAG TPA: hypothetical protein VJP04_06300 [Terriglobales bacterium]|nr:hypothetical protein [Terriglobales bacterium]
MSPTFNFIGGSVLAELFLSAAQALCESIGAPRLQHNKSINAVLNSLLRIGFLSAMWALSLFPKGDAVNLIADHLPAGTVASKVAAAQQLEVHGRSWLRLFSLGPGA